MHLLRAITEDEMVSVFLKTEINSVRFEQEILALLHRDKRDRSVIDMPALNDIQENTYRLQLLGDFRGYRRNAGMFIGFPDHVEWHRASLTPDELMQVRYIDYSYWNELSDGTRLPMVAAQTIRAGRVIYGQSTQGYLRLAEELCRGGQFPELILTAVSLSAPLVVMEGHVRLTTYALSFDCLPMTVEVIVGFSPDFSKWGAHGTP